MVTMPSIHGLLTEQRNLGLHNGLVCAVVIGLCLSYAATTLDRGWVPHDTGQLGQTAERVLQGELQHRDFDEPYTGGLGCLNALAMELFGVRAESIRWMLFAYFALFLGAVYWIARRISSITTTVLVTMLCAALCIPVYAEGLPSWYNLFFATLATAALLRHLETAPKCIFCRDAAI